ncbi:MULTISPECIES: type III secretion system export apparatus subunit SctU [unclassified Achromobacter]|uniref:type III secretion system export apparatus subunit SctU n=1 Tax=unclassified Achromobacter TaxID=2626865 RepID=UPI0013032C52|nr:MULTISPECIES: type III secretion system export apparatus subunit SctU [unclassified Achromobacter]
MSEAKTEPPSHKKLRDSRKKGDVPYSKDFSQSILLVSLLGYALFGGGALLPALKALMEVPTGVYGLPFHQALTVVGTRCLTLMLQITLPFIGILLVVGFMADVLQVGFLVAFEKVKPSGKKLNVVENAKNLVSARNLVETLKAVVKIVAFSWFIYVLIKDAVRPLAYAGYAGIAPFFALVSQLMKKLLLYVALLCTVLAAFDFSWQRMQRTKRLRMTKQEVKREYKEQEGSPEIKQKRKQIRNENANDSTQLAKKATAVVANPTHIAIALYYEQERTPLPVLLAKGCDDEALDMIAAAKEEGVPIMRDIPLARRLYADAPVEAYIPTEFIEPVAAVLRWARSLDGDGADVDGVSDGKDGNDVNDGQTAERTDGAATAHDENKDDR